MLDKHLDRNHPVGGQTQPKPETVQLPCPNAGCPFKSQDLPKEQAQKMLDNHMPRCKVKPAAPSSARAAPASTSVTSSEEGGYFVKLSGMVWSATKDDIENFLSDCSIKDIAMIKTETGRASGKNISWQKISIHTPVFVKWEQPLFKFFKADLKNLKSG